MSDRRFKSVEKIKTIGETYMAAAGLNIKTMVCLIFSFCYFLMCQFFFSKQPSNVFCGSPNPKLIFNTFPPNQVSLVLEALGEGEPMKKRANMSMGCDYISHYKFCSNRFFLGVS